MNVYHPNLGRWATMDPVGYAAGDANLYGFVGQNPINFLDPLGLLEQAEGKTTDSVSEKSDYLGVFKTEWTKIRVFSWSIKERDDDKAKCKVCDIKLYANMVSVNSAKVEKVKDLIGKITPDLVGSGVSDLIDLLGPDVIKSEIKIAIEYSATVKKACKDISKKDIAEALELEKYSKTFNGMMKDFKDKKFDQYSVFNNPLSAYTKEYAEMATLHWKIDIITGLLAKLKD
jgi:hypothetical protein